MLFGEPHALLAQMIDHPVVDADQLVDLRLTDRQEPRRELLVADQPQPLASHPELPKHLTRQAHPDGERQHEHRLDGQQPDRVVEEEIGAQRREDQMEDNEVDDGPRAQAHTLISYFSKRR